MREWIVVRALAGGLVASLALAGAAFAQEGLFEEEEGLFGGGEYDDGEAGNDWFYDRYTREEGFGAGNYDRGEFGGYYDDMTPGDDWYYDQYGAYAADEGLFDL